MPVFVEGDSQTKNNDKVANMIILIYHKVSGLGTVTFPFARFTVAVATKHTIMFTKVIDMNT